MQIVSILQLITSIFDAPTALVGLFQETKVFIKDATGRWGDGFGRQCGLTFDGASSSGHVERMLGAALPCNLLHVYPQQ